MFILPALFILNCISFVQGRRNITLDDSDSQFQYSGDWGRSANTSLNYGDSHVLTTNPASTATINFTGVAVYFLSPLWPYAVSTALTLDSRPTVTVDLTDYSQTDTGGGPESVGSEVVWSAENLANTTHTLRISVGRGQQFAVVDGIIYTVLDPGESLSSSDSSENVQNQVLPIALGTVLGVLALILIALILWLCLRRRREPATTSPRSSNKWPADNASFGNVREDPNSPRQSVAAPSPVPVVAASRPDSNYQPGETAWSTSSVGGPGVPNMTGVGVSARNSRAASYRPGDPMPFGVFHPGPLPVDHAPEGPYANPNRSNRYPDV